MLRHLNLDGRLLTEDQRNRFRPVRRPNEHPHQRRQQNRGNPAARQQTHEGADAVEEAEKHRHIDDRPQQPRQKDAGPNPEDANGRDAEAQRLHRHEQQSGDVAGQKQSHPPHRAAEVQVDAAIADEFGNQPGGTDQREHVGRVGEPD